MAVRLLAPRTSCTLLPRNIIFLMFPMLISVRGWQILFLNLLVFPLFCPCSLVKHQTLNGFVRVKMKLLSFWTLVKKRGEFVILRSATSWHYPLVEGTVEGIPCYCKMRNIGREMKINSNVRNKFVDLAVQKLRGLSPRSNYTNLMTSACWRS
jgi:hypothetical protein